jgi:hypothetical protein
VSKRGRRLVASTAWRLRVLTLGWLYWDEFLFDQSGTQEQESRAFVEMLSKMMGVSIIPPGR